MPEDKIQPGMVFVDGRDDSVEWYVKYADDEVVVSRKTGECYHKFNRRNPFEKMAGVNSDEDEVLESRFQFTGEIVDEDDVEQEETDETDDTTSLLNL